MRIKITVFILLILSVTFGLTPHVYSQQKFKTVRVLLGNYTNLNVSSLKGLKIKDLDTGKTLLRLRAESSINIFMSDSYITVKGKRAKGLKIISSNDEIVVNKTTYQGQLLFHVVNGKFQVINIVPLEIYLKSVVPGEILASSPLEALKAQAIASRSFTVYNILKSEKRFYDLSKNSQNYQGKLYNVNPNVVKAVNATKGRIMLYVGEVFGSYFHANCGGNTEYAGNIWKEETYPVSIKCTHCKKGNHYLWKSTVTTKEIEKKLNENGYSLKNGLAALYPAKVSSVSARTTVLIAEDAIGKKHKIRSDKFRNIIGSEHLRSTNFTFAAYQDGFVFTGKGWGHGVGMCQDGAVSLANSGKKYKEILQYYYPDIKIKKI